MVYYVIYIRLSEVCSFQSATLPATAPIKRYVSFQSLSDLSFEHDGVSSLARIYIWSCLKLNCFYAAGNLCDVS